MADQFLELSENDSTSLVDRKNSENTKKGTKVALNVFREYLKERKVALLMPSVIERLTVSTIQVYKYNYAEKETN